MATSPKGWLHRKQIRTVSCVLSGRVLAKTFAD